MSEHDSQSFINLSFRYQGQLNRAIILVKLFEYPLFFGLEWVVSQLGWLESLRKRMFIMSLEENQPVEWDLLLPPLLFQEKQLQLSHRWIFMFGFVRHLHDLAR